MKINPIRKHKPIEQVFENLFDRSLSDLFDANFSNSTPSANIIEEEGRYIIELAVPGIDKKDIKLTLEENQLIVSCEKENTGDNKDENENYKRREYNYNSFKRSFHMPETVNQDTVEAKYNNGILLIELTKKEESKEQPPKTINIL